MDKTIYSKKIAESLSSGNHPEEFATLFVTLLRQLVLGRPVSLVALDAALGWPAQRVATVLKQAPGTEYDEQGNILGLGLTLRETPHVFEVEGRRLYTWCALDTLMFPVLIGKTARVASRCAATGTPITLTVAPEAVLDVEPAETMVSLLTPGTSPDIRCSFCCHVHFFASPSAANAWALTHQGIEVVPVESAFGLGQCRTNLMPAALYGSGTFADRQVLKNGWMFLFAEPTLVEFANELHHEIPESRVVQTDGSRPRVAAEQKIGRTFDVSNSPNDDAQVRCGKEQYLTLAPEIFDSELGRYKSARLEWAGQFREQVIATFNSSF